MFTTRIPLPAVLLLTSIGLGLPGSSRSRRVM
jgi:hypothetical protein